MKHHQNIKTPTFLHIMQINNLLSKKRDLFSLITMVKMIILEIIFK